MDWQGGAAGGVLIFHKARGRRFVSPRGSGCIARDKNDTSHASAWRIPSWIKDKNTLTHTHQKKKTTATSIYKNILSYGLAFQICLSSTNNYGILL